jgi:hypothetical protein
MLGRCAQVPELGSKTTSKPPPENPRAIAGWHAGLARLEIAASGHE